MTDYTTLAATVAAGDDWLVLCSGAALIHYVTVEPDSAREQKVRVWRHFGTGPCNLRLGYGDKHPLFLRYAHAAGSPVRFETVSAELAAALAKAATGPCAHLDSVPVDALGEIVAWLCPECDEELPPDWDDVGVRRDRFEAAERVRRARAEAFEAWIAAGGGPGA